MAPKLPERKTGAEAPEKYGYQQSVKRPCGYLEDEMPFG